jgi:hypothetical protein
MNPLNEQITSYLYQRTSELGIPEDAIDQFAYGLAIASDVSAMQQKIAYNRNLIMHSLNFTAGTHMVYLLLFDSLEQFLKGKSS